MTERVNELAMELVTASMSRGGEAAFVKYANQRLDEELDAQDDAYELIEILATFASGAVRAWAEDTDRDPMEVMQVIALASASDLYNDEEM